MSSATPQDITYEDVVVQKHQGVGQPEVRVRCFFDKRGEELPPFDVFVGGWALRQRYATREGAFARAEREVEIARLQRKGHFW